jgi:hypothetical protein
MFVLDVPFVGQRTGMFVGAISMFVGQNGLLVGELGIIVGQFITAGHAFFTPPMLVKIVFLGLLIPQVQHIW